MINNVDNCLEVISNKHFFIQDEEGSSPALVKYDDGQFGVINNTSDNISFLKIDDCIDFGKETKKCDCAIYNDNVFCFIELKTLKSKKGKTKKERRRTAEKQLKYTIDNFKDETILQNKNKEAYISFTCNIDNKLTEIPNIGNADKKLEFKEDLNTRLYYSCKKEFN